MADDSVCKVQSNRLLPLHISEVEEQQLSGGGKPHSAIQSITMGIRVGAQKWAIGYIKKFSFSAKRNATPIYQIEPYPGIKGDDEQPPAGISTDFTTLPDGYTHFCENTAYYPGEAVEVIPGKMEPMELTLDRYAVYTANLLAAVMRATGGGVYTNASGPPHVPVGDTDPILYVNLLQQVRPFDIYQVFVSPLTGGVLWGRKFGGCWFTEISEDVPEAKENMAILENGKVQATYMRPLTTSI
ncbi:MAG: hypothetical protein ACTSPI_15765 [Candidatus Heimdallarchaeaceae archaeon]